MVLDLSEKLLEISMNGISKLSLACHAVELAEDAANLGLAVGEWIASHSVKLIQLTRLVFSGSILSLVSSGLLLIVNNEDIVFGEKVDISFLLQPWKLHQAQIPKIS